MIVKEALAAAADRLAAAGVEDAAREAGWLLAHALGTSAGTLRVRQHEPLTAETRGRFAHLLDRRAAREPIQYILGTEEFMGLEFQVSPAVLIPRLDTETLVRAALGWLPAGPGVRVADIGTGSGAIAVAVSVNRPEAAVVATDISPEALAVARTNAERIGVAGRIDFRLGDLLEPLGDGRFDAILSNPPYIDEAEWCELAPEVCRWEPRLALTPGVDGLEPYRRLAAGGPPLLKPGGFLTVEVGYQQAAAVADLFAAAGLLVEIRKDTGGIDRVVLGRILSF